jgi:beta-fructofuranosidase
MGEGEALSLDVFIDRSVIEVFANGRQAITRRVYFHDPDIISVSILQEGDAKVRELSAWEIAAANPY